MTVGHCDDTCIHRLSKSIWVNAKRPTRVICAGGALWLPSGPMEGSYLSRRMVLPCVVLRSCLPTSCSVPGLAGLPPHRKASRAYTSPLAALDAALPIRAICARLSRGTEVEVMHVM